MSAGRLIARKTNFNQASLPFFCLSMPRHTPRCLPQGEGKNQTGRYLRFFVCFVLFFFHLNAKASDNIITYEISTGDP